MIYFTADHHFGHANIIKYCERPFNDVNHMDNVLIERWNSRVSPDDTVYHLGDFCLGNEWVAHGYVNRLYGNICIVPSLDHDQSWLKRYRNIFPVEGKAAFIQSPLHLIQHDGYKITLCHYPMEEWSASFHGSLHLHGHTHGRSKKKENRYDVGVDNYDFYPMTLEEILDKNQ